MLIFREKGADGDLKLTAMARTLCRTNLWDFEVGTLRQRGKQYLQIPESNKCFSDIEEYAKIAKDKYNIEIIFLKEEL